MPVSSVKPSSIVRTRLSCWALYTVSVSAAAASPEPQPASAPATVKADRAVAVVRTSLVT